MKNNSLAIKKKIIKWYIMFYPICDILYTLTSSLGLTINFNQIIRGFGLILFFSCIKSKNDFIKIFGIIVAVLISFVYNANFGPGINLVTDFAFALKIINNFILYYAFLELYKRKILKIDEVAGWLIFSAYIVIGSIFLSYIGIGLTSYSGSGRFGVKGLFTIQSAITLYLLVILPVIYYKYKKLISFKMMICIFALFSIGSKTGVFGTILVYIALMITDYREGEKKHVLKWKQLVQYLIIFFVAFTVGFYLMRNYISYLINLYNEKTYYYSIEAFLLSNRNDQIRWVENAVNNYKGNRVLGILLGYSYSGIASLVKQYGYRFEAIERDFHGVYFYFGIIILAILFLLIFKVGKKILVNNRIYKFKESSLYVSALTLGIGALYAFLGGHLFYEAMNQIPFWALSTFGTLKATRYGIQNKVVS